MIYNAISMVIMFLVTYIPRALPITFFRHKIKSNFIKSFLFYVPYAVLAAMTFPAIFYFINNIYIAIAGTACACILAFFKQKLIVVAAVSSLLVLVLLLIFGKYY